MPANSALAHFAVTVESGNLIVHGDQEVSAATRVFLANDPDCYAATCEMLGDADLRPWLSTFRMPVAVVVGEEDYATPIAAARQLHEAIAGSTLTILKGRHLTPIECPDEIAGLLLELPGRACNKKIP